MREVVVSGVGLVSCIGNDIDTVVTNLRNGNSGISRNEVYEQMGFRSCVSGSIDLNLRELIDRKKLRFMGNAAAYGFLAAEMAIADAGLTPEKISSPKVGLIAGSGVGKSVLLGMLTKFTSADVVVIGLIGERGREVKEFIEQILGPEGMGHAVVVAAPADNSPLLRIRATNLAHLYAEYFRAQGKDVLLLVDSMSRVAHAQREIGLAIGEPPTSKGYPPSVFSLLPNLIERTGTGSAGQGTITALYTLLAEGDDLQDPVVDLARASLDGQVVLSRALADVAHYPAIDLAGSISRLMPAIADIDDLNSANMFRRLWTLYQQNIDLIQVGAYEMGTNPDLDRAIALRNVMEEFLRQPMDELVTFEDAIAQLRESIRV